MTDGPAAEIDAAIAIRSASVAASTTLMCGDAGSSVAMSLVITGVTGSRPNAVRSTGSPLTSSRFDSTVRPIARIRRAHDRPGIRMARPPRRKRPGHLPRHRPAHRRIDFQEDAIDAGVHQRRHRIGGQFFSGFVVERAAVGGDGDRRSGESMTSRVVRTVRLEVQTASVTNVSQPRFANCTDASPAPVKSSATSPSTAPSS